VQQVTAASVALNLLPLPVLTAGHLLVAAMPRAAPRLRRAQPVAAALLVVALVAGWLPDPGPALLAAVSLVR
jgi:hypothetical protein